MARHRKRISRRVLLATAAVATGAVLAPVAVQAATADTAGREQNPVRALEQAAHPLRTTEPGGNTADLRALGSMIGDAKVVGLGEATHGSHEFFTMKERVFRHLVEKKGFTTFALELSWSAGLQIDDYLQTGKGDARKIAKETLTNSPWDREEFVSLIEWMRDYNRHHPDRTVHFMGDDIGAPSLSDEFFGRVTGYVQKNNPEALPRLNELYTGLRPIDDVFAYLGKPLAERQQLAVKAQQALELVSGLKGSGGDAFDWAEQNARSVAQTAKFLTLNPDDPESNADSQRFRDEVMAQNVSWWQQRTGQKVLLSAHNDHVAYVASDPETYSKTQGSFLRDTMGKNYLPIGFTFNQGSFLSKDAALGGEWKKFTVPAAEPDRNEATLDKVRYRDFYLDIRTAPAAARDWLNAARPTLNVGTLFPEEPRDAAIAKSYDVLIHLHEVREADKLKP
ncbi:erythromycin esterase family protein [Streptomyces atratus]|uniref:Erythromycin esterase n=1 Tax=Streptomyces atratus TaxID=1893 RepID=A0A2Z5JG14_STRAR|nr:erythromycin esterase family protein [Streptomyces atratus]AXE79307.1 erythromycin esterase [Streptomyces atratus]